MSKYFDRAMDYAQRVVDGVEVAGKFERLACARFLNDLQREGDSDLPVGLQWIGPHGADELVLALGAAWQRASAHHLARPALAQEAQR